MDGTKGNDLIIGTSRADTVNALEGRDTVSGGAGNDTINGGAGNDGIDGGAGVDTAVYGGNRNQYTLTHNSDGSFTVADIRGGNAADGTDTLRNVEFAQFGNGNGKNLVDLSTVAPCFAAGTRIGTARGEVAVEELREGDLVALADGGGFAPAVWIGRRTVAIDLHAWPDLVRPLRIQAGALAEGVPSRDLLVSPEHAFLVDGALVPAGLLANGRSIAPELGVRRVTYFHVELPGHGVILAEGAPAESYLDVGNRTMFEGGAVVALNPRFDAPAGAAAAWCAPRVEGGEALTAIRSRLIERAEGFAFSPTEEHDLRLLVDGREVRGHRADGGAHTFGLPAGAAEVRIVSRASCPAAEAAAWGADRRLLGVALTAIALRGAGGAAVEVPLGHESLARGFHPIERQEDGRAHRWTDGDAALPAQWFAPLLAVGPATLEIRVGGFARYWTAQAPAERAATAAA